MISAACSCHLDLSWTDEHAVVFGARKIGFALDRTIILALSHFQYQTWRRRENNPVGWIMTVGLPLEKPNNLK